MTGSHPLRKRLERLGTRSLPKLLTLQDRNPHSPTYGCFDRNFWHLRITDFPSGMAQEFVLPLALAYSNRLEGNDFFGDPMIREWVRAGISYAARSAHSDGACDDYYPFEKAAGAAAFSLYACIEAIPAARLDPAPFLPFLTQRAEWLARHHESGRLSNHEALIANALYRLSALVGEPRFAELGRRRLDRLLTWQSEEGWFFEYQGCDPGYLSLTIANLAELAELRPELPLKAPLLRAIGFLHSLQPPDGWLGGEWTSRNTNNFFPHGFELLGKTIPEALDINTRAVGAMDPAPEYDDDHIIGHHCWSYIKTALSWRDTRPEPSVSPDRDVVFPEAGLSLLRKGPMTLLTAEKKGGAFRLYRGDRLIHADTGVSLQLRRGDRTRTYVCHLWSDDNEIERCPASVTVSGAMGRAKSSQMTPLKNLVLRSLMLTLGRFNPDLIRAILQRLLITGKPRSGLRFARHLALDDSGLTVRDRIEGGGEIVDCGIGPAQTSIYTVMSRVYHPVQRQPWCDLSAEIMPGSALRLDHTRRIGEAE